MRDLMVSRESNVSISLKERTASVFFFCSVVVCIVSLTALPLHSAQTILTGVPRKGISEKVRTFVINSVTDARCLISASGFEEQDSVKALADCRQKHMVLAPVIDVGAKLAIAMENKLRKSGSSESAIKAGVKRRLQTYDGCVRNEIGPRQTLPLEGLAQLCAVSKTGSPKDGVPSMVTKERSITNISVYNFDEIIFDSLIDQEKNGKSVPSSPSASVTAASCPEKTCNRCRAVGFSSNYVAVPTEDKIAWAFPDDRFPGDFKKFPAKDALQEDERELFIRELEVISPDLRLDDIWVVNNKNLGPFLCMVCPQGYVSNGLDGCIRNGCPIGETCRVCPSHQIADFESGTCMAACEKANRSFEEYLNLKRTELIEVGGKGLVEFASSVLEADKAACARDKTQNVSGRRYLSELLFNSKGCESGRIIPPGCQKACTGRDIYPGSLVFGDCPNALILRVIDRIHSERGSTCNTPITARDIRDRIAEIGFNCQAYSRTEKHGRVEPGSADSKQRPE